MPARFLSLAIALLCLTRCRPETRRESHRPQIVAQPARPPRTPAPASSPRPAWTEALNLSAGVADFAPRANVLVHAPEGFDPSRPFDLVVLFHGFGHSPYFWLGGGMLDPLTRQRIVGWGGGQRHDLAGTNSLIVALQCDDRPGHRRLGRVGRAGGLRGFIDELLRDALAQRLGGPRSLHDVASIVLVGSSAGGPSIGALLARRELDEKVRAVVLFDGLYGDPRVFSDWLLRAPSSRRLVHVYGGTSEAEARTVALAAMLLPRLRGAMLRLSRETMTEAVAAHNAVIARVPCEHVGMVGAYLDKILRGLGLAPRAGARDLKTPAAPLPPRGQTLAEGALEGRLSRGDGALRDGALFDLYDLDLTAGERVTIEARGGRVPMHTCATLDVELRVFEDGALVAANDDGLPGRGSAVYLTAARATRYRVLVTAHDPWRQEGPYRLTLRRQRAGTESRE